VVRGSDVKRSSLPALSAAVVLSLAALTARAETITLRWRYAAPERIAGFRVHTGPAAGQYTRTVDVGQPAPDADGVFSARVDVADGEPTHLAVSAYDANGVESPLSGDREHAASASAPSQPGRPEVVEP
jgi:hypothetical protein